MILGMHAAVRSRVRDVLADLYRLDSDELPDVTIQYPPDRSMGDVGVTVAFELARVLRKAPRAIAAEIVGALGPVEGVDRVEPAPNGYVNIFLDRARFARAALAAAPLPTEAGRGIHKAIVEHTAINPNKAAHVGHLRNAALGDTLVRLLRHLGVPVEVQNYIDDTGVQVADVVVGFEQLEQLPPEEVAALADRPRFDYYCWDLYARVTAWYEDDPERLGFRSRALHDLEAGIDPTARLGRLVADRIVRCHLATMDRMNIEYDLLTWEGDILRLRFWSRAFDVLKAAGAIRLETTGSQAGCWVMPLDGDTPPDADRGADEGGPKSKSKVIVRSNGTVTYVGKDIAYQFWKLGVLEHDFHYRLHGAQRSGHPLWSTTSSPTAPGRDEAGFGRADAVYNVIDTRQAYLQQLLRQALTAVGRGTEAERSVHVSYEMVALSPATARALGHDLDPEAARPFVEVSGRKGLGVKADDLLDRLTEAARRRGHRAPCRPVGGRPRGQLHRDRDRHGGNSLLHDQVLAREAHRLRHRRGVELRRGERPLRAVRRGASRQHPAEALRTGRPGRRGARRRARGPCRPSRSRTPATEPPPGPCCSRPPGSTRWRINRFALWSCPCWPSTHSAWRRCSTRSTIAARSWPRRTSRPGCGAPRRFSTAADS